MPVDVNPAVITDAELAAAAEFAARDAAAFDAEWAGLSAAEREECEVRWVVADAQGRRVEDADDTGDVEAASDAADGDDDAVGGLPRWRSQESGWLALAAAGGGGVTLPELLAIATAAPGSLGDPGQVGLAGDAIGQLQCLDRLTAALAGHRHGIIAALCPADDDTPGSFRAEQHLVEEIAVAARVGPVTAERAIEVARLLAGPFARSRTDLLAGSISDSHVRVLAQEIRNVVDDPTPHPDLVLAQDAPAPRSRDQKLRQVQDRVAAYAHKQTPGQYARTIRAAIAAVDPAGEADRHAAAKATRDVSVSRDPDGMGVLVDRDDHASVTAIHEALTAAAKLLQAERGGTAAARKGALDARIGACRADVLKTLVLGRAPGRCPTTGSGGTGLVAGESAAGAAGADSDSLASVDSGGPGQGRVDGTGLGPASSDLPAGQGLARSWEPPARVLEGQLVIDLPTLLGLRDNPGMLDGAVIPAPMACELAAKVTWWRRMVTDPVTGHLLDYGSRTYLPGPLVRYTKARDGQCAAPYCQRPASRCQMDHRIPHPEGPSASWNCGAFCERHHPLKTDGWIAVLASDASGAITYRTLWGQHVTTEPNPYLPNPRPPDRRPPDRKTEHPRADDDTGPSSPPLAEPDIDDEPPF